MPSELDLLSEHLSKLKSSKAIIIVEGPYDKKALTQLGIKKDRILTLSKTPLYKVVETATSKSKDCIILTDLDKKGKQLYAKLNTDLSQRGVRIDNTFREFLFKHTKLSHIEGLFTYVERLKQK